MTCVPRPACHDLRAMIGAVTSTLADLDDRIHRLLTAYPLVDGHNDFPWAARQQVGDDVTRLDLAQRLTTTSTDLPPDLLDGQPHAIVERDGVRYTLLGTAHVSRASVDAVEQCVASGRYDAYLEQGLLIGSGPIESAHRHVIQRRMKQAGQHWEERGGRRMARMRAAYRTAGPRRFFEAIHWANRETMRKGRMAKPTKRRASNR